MANVDWASKFFNAVTSKLPDLLTKHGEGKEMAALDELRADLGSADKEAKAERAKQLQAELDELNGKAPAVDRVAAVDQESKATDASKPVRR